MLRKIHQVDIIVNGEPIELYDAEKLNLRMNNVIFKPEEITSKNGEYSFSFEIPATPKNNKIFNFANNQSKLNKFNTLYDCEVNVDGINIFTGTLRLSGTKEDKYICNLISIKVNKVEDIFGETMMNELNWKIDFDGTGTINTYNMDDTGNRGIYFPLVCYGAFQKKSYATYGNDYNIYTDLLDIDNTNLWYWESFHPSFNLIELVRRCFAHKGYTLNGDILNDNILKQMYLSEYIDSSQDPVYNLNKDNIGKLRVSGRFRSSNISGNTSYDASGKTSSLVLINDLQYPKNPIENLDDVYDFSKVFVYDIFLTPAAIDDPTQYHSMNWPGPSNDYIYRKANKNSTAGYIQVPADGLYTIELQCGISVGEVYDDDPNAVYTYQKPRHNGEWGEDSGIEYDTILLDATKKNFDWMPVEVQLVRNTDEPELIWTAEDIIKQTTSNPGKCQYPHEADANALIDGGKNGNTINTNSSGWRVGGNRATQNLGDRYYVDKGTTIAYDPKVNPGFICGFTTANKSCSVMKNGRSWDPTVSEFNHTHYRQPGYKRSVWSGNQSTGYNVSRLTDKNSNTLDCPNTDYWSQVSNQGQGRVTCVVELKKNDQISLKVLTKGLYGLKYTSSGQGGTAVIPYEWGTYNPEITYNLTITPYTPNTNKYLNKQNMYYLPTDAEKETAWGTKLNLGNFLNSKEKMADFINNFIKTFNLQYNQVGQNVFINKNKMDMVTIRNEVDIDDRVITSEAQSERIDYPGTMQVKWAIADDEAGAYRSIDTVEHQSANNWKDYIDRGSEKVQMDTTNESKTDTIDSKFSYTWYQDFTYYDYDRSTRTPNGNTSTFRLPLIAKDEDFIIQSEDAMQKDGLSLKQRLWFRDQYTSKTLEMWNGQEARVTIPVPEYNGCTLNYNNEQGSLLDRYFNVTPRTDSNYLVVECYLTPTEYVMLKNGAFTKFDDDLYLVSEIGAYDPVGTNKTELHLIKKV